MHLSVTGVRYLATGIGTKSQSREALAREHVKELSDKQRVKRQARAIDKVCNHSLND